MANPASASSTGMSRRDAIPPDWRRWRGEHHRGGRSHLAGATAADQAAPEHQAAIERLIIALNNGAMTNSTRSSLRTRIPHLRSTESDFGLEGFKQLLARRAGDRVVDAVRARGRHGDGRPGGGALDAARPDDRPRHDATHEGTTLVEGQFICRFRGNQVAQTWNVSFARNADEIDGD